MQRACRGPRPSTERWRFRAKRVPALEPGEASRYGRAVHGPGGRAAAPGQPPPALAYWLSADDLRTVRAAAQRAAASAATPALLDALTELDAAEIRSRWFDHPSAPTFRHVAGHGADAVALRLTNTEHHALADADVAVADLLDNDTRSAGPRPVKAPASTSGGASTKPSRAAGPVVVLECDSGGLAWAVAEFDGQVVHVSRPAPGAAPWDVAYHESLAELVDVVNVAAARRLIARTHPSLSSLALARADLRPAAGEVVLLHLPDVVVLAPAAVAARVAAYAAPVPVVALRAEAVPGLPSSATTTNA